MKNYLRKISLEKRKTLPVALYSKQILDNLFLLDEYKKAKNILSYYPLSNEVQVQECLSDESKNWFLPRVNGLELEICPFDKKALICGAFGIQEPSNSQIDSNSILDMIIIPAVAADISGHRIGYGKGFYDRFLSSLDSSPCKVLLVFSDMLYESVYPDSYDVKVDFIITDKEILKIDC